MPTVKYYLVLRHVIMHQIDTTVLGILFKLFLSHKTRVESDDPEAINVVISGASSFTVSGDFGGRCTAAKQVTGPECSESTCADSNFYDVMFTSL